MRPPGAGLGSFAVCFRGLGNHSVPTDCCPGRAPGGLDTAVFHSPTQCPCVCASPRSHPSLGTDGGLGDNPGVSPKPGHPGEPPVARKGTQLMVWAGDGGQDTQDTSGTSGG